MKNIKLIFGTLTLLILGACTDLDLEPKNAVLPNVFFQDEDNYIRYVAKIYASFTLTGQNGPAGDGDISIISDEGFSSYMRAYWKAQELTTDEAVIRWTDAGIQDLNTHSWSSDNQFVRVLYYRIFYTTSLCNDFLENTTASKLDENNISQDFRDEVNQMRLEVRFCRALAYWHALDLFQNVALVTDITSDLPRQTPPQAMYEFLVAELSACVNELPEAGAAEYGRVSSEAARMLRAKVRLNAGNYVDNPPVDRFGRVVEDMNAVIQAGYTLEPTYLHLFNADNDDSPEIIWAMTQDGINSQSWGGTTFMVRAMIFEDFMDSEKWGVISGWSGIRTTPEFVNLFEDGQGNLDYSDSRNIIYTEGRIESTQSDILGDSLGFLMAKFSNITSDSVAGADGDHVDVDYPYFRLGDAYLMYAEATLRGASNGDRGTALNYINQLRERAYGDNSGNIVDGDLTLDFILEERGRELYYEATRRIDLIRFNKFSNKGGANELFWEWKGGAPAGTSVAAYKEIFPIPSSDLAVNENLSQNNGY